MTLSVSKGDLDTLVNKFVPVKTVLGLDRMLTVYITTGPFSGYVSADLRVVSDGTIEIDISRASLAGFSVFGAVRKVIGELVIEKTKGMPAFKVWKNRAGNLQFQVYGVWFESVVLQNGTATVIANFGAK